MGCKLPIFCGICDIIVMLRICEEGDVMKSIKLKAYGKINLTLDVVGKYDDGFHKLEMIMQAVHLADDILIRWWENNDSPVIDIELKTNKYYISVDQRNLAYKAAQLVIEKHFNDKGGKLRIDIGKKLPVAAGMAGGSSDCAAVMLGLNHIWNLGLSLEELCKLSEELGSDIPFSIISNAKGNKALDKSIRENKMASFCAIARGKGTEIEPIKPLDSLILVSKPPISVSTKEVYQGLVLNEIIKRPNNEGVIKALEEESLTVEYARKTMVNVLETYTLNKYKLVCQTKEEMKKACKNSFFMMSGSGPTVFGLIPNEKELKVGFYKLKSVNRETYMTRTMV